MDKKQRSVIIIAIIILIIAVICLFTMHTDLTNTRAQVDDLTAQLNTATEATAAAQAEVETLTAENADLTTQLTEAQAEVQAIGDELATLQTELETMQATIDTLTAEKTELKAQLTDAASLTTDSAATQEQIDALTAENADLETRLTAALAEIEQLKLVPAEEPAEEAVAAVEEEPVAEETTVAEEAVEQAPVVAQAPAALTQLTLQDGAVALNMSNAAQAGQSMVVRLMAGEAVLGEATLTDPAAVLETLPLDAVPEAGSEIALEYAIYDADGNLVYRVSMPVDIAE